MTSNHVALNRSRGPGEPDEKSSEGERLRGAGSRSLSRPLRPPVRHQPQHAIPFSLYMFLTTAKIATDRPNSSQSALKKYAILLVCYMPSAAWMLNMNCLHLHNSRPKRAGHQAHPQYSGILSV